MESSVLWKEGMSFDADIEGFHLKVQGGGNDVENKEGPGPKVLVLTALSGCTALDVISILEKMKEKVTRFEVKAIGETAVEHPKRIVSITLCYYVDGENIKLENVKKAVSLSLDKYCGVYATLVNAVKMDRKIFLNGMEQA